MQPSLRKMMDDAHVMGCLQKMKAIALSMSLYAEDHSLFPASYEDGSTYVSYSDLLAPYDGRGELPDNILRVHEWHDPNTGPNYRSESYTCPQEDVVIEITSSIGKVSRVSRLSYFPNAYYLDINIPLGFTGPNNGDDGQWVQSPSFYLDPQGTIALVEKSGDPNLLYSIGNPVEVAYPYSQSERNVNGDLIPGLHLGSRDRWHKDGWNYLFIDGHAQNLLPEETINPNGNMGHEARGMWSWIVGD